MAIGLRIKLPGGTAAMYEAVDAELDVEGNPPEGLILHSAGPIEDGWGVIDFWESREHFDRFQEARLGPAIATLGENGPDGPPDIKEFPVHKLIKP